MDRRSQRLYVRAGTTVRFKVVSTPVADMSNANVEWCDNTPGPDLVEKSDHATV
jgi:hypothetical protein